MAPAILSSVIRYIRIHAIRTYAFLPFLSFPSPIRSRASYGGNPVFGRFLTPWIPIPPLRRGQASRKYTPFLNSSYFFIYFFEIQYLVFDIPLLYRSSRGSPAYRDRVSVQASGNTQRAGAEQRRE